MLLFAKFLIFLPTIAFAKWAGPFSDPPVIIENARKVEYYEVLEYAQKKSDGPFVCFLADEMKRTASVIRKHIR